MSFLTIVKILTHEILIPFRQLAIFSVGLFFNVYGNLKLNCFASRLRLAVN